MLPTTRLLTLVFTFGEICEALLHRNRELAADNHAVNLHLPRK